MCLTVFHQYAKRKNLDPKFIDFVEWIAIFAIIAGVISSILFQNLYDFIEDPEHFHFNLALTFMGGLIGGVVTFLIIYFIKGRGYESSLVDMLGIVPCCITVAHGFGRIGCTLSGCCYGRPTDAWYGMYFYENPTVKVVPTQLFEAIFLFILFGILTVLVLKTKFKHNMELYMICYGVWRFIIEFYRDDHRGSFIPGLTPSQFWSILMVALGIALWIWFAFFFDKFFTRKPPRPILSDDATLNTTNDVKEEVTLENNKIEEVKENK